MTGIKEAHQRARDKIVATAERARRSGLTQPISIEFTIPELRAMDYMHRCLDQTPLIGSP